MKVGAGNRTRVLDGLIVAAIALLVLKLTNFVFSPAEPALAPDGLPSFAHGLARARSNYEPPDPRTTGSVAAKPKEAAPPPAPEPPPKMEPPPPPGPSASERAISERLGERRDELKQKARDVEQREQILADIEKKLDARSDEMRQREEQEAAAQAATPAKAEAQALKGLVTMYETMKPKDAARVFDRLPADVLLPVVRQMNPRKMAEIMAAMSSDGAEKLTVALARPAAAPRPPERAGDGLLPPGELPALAPPARAAARSR